MPSGHKTEDRNACRKVFEEFLKTDLFFTRGNKPNNRRISSTSQRKTTLEGEKSCKCCKTKLEVFLVNLFSVRREKKSWRGWGYCLRTYPACILVKKKIRFYLLASSRSLSCYHWSNLTTSSERQVYRGDPWANPYLKQDLKAAWKTHNISSHKRTHKHPRDTKCLTGNMPHVYQLFPSPCSLWLHVLSSTVNFQELTVSLEMLIFCSLQTI